jgi:hypothetical protein
VPSRCVIPFLAVSFPRPSLIN